MREEKEEEAEEGRNWFSRWEEELPSPEELMPLSQTLITPDLAMAFDIPNPNAASPNPNPTAGGGFHTPSSSHHQQHQHQQADFDSADLNNGSGGGSGGGGGGNGGDESARTLKRPRLVWTPQLHKRFVDAVAHLGIKNAVPKTIMQLMSVDGLTRENVASHLQKYRLYLKRMQGLNSSGGGGGGGGSSCSAADAATDQLFASAPIPHHFLTRSGGGGGGGVTGQTEPSFMPFVPVAALQHHQQMVAAAAAAAAAQHQQQQQYYQQRQMGFDHGFLARGAPQPGFSRMGLHGMVQPVSTAAAYNVDDFEEGNRGGGGGGGGGRKVLTLFPTGDD